MVFSESSTCTKYTKIKLLNIVVLSNCNQNGLVAQYEKAKMGKSSTFKWLKLWVGRVWCLTDQELIGKPGDLSDPFVGTIIKSSKDSVNNNRNWVGVEGSWMPFLQSFSCDQNVDFNYLFRSIKIIVASKVIFVEKAFNATFVWIDWTQWLYFNPLLMFCWQVLDQTVQRSSSFSQVRYDFIFKPVAHLH